MWDIWNVAVASFPLLANRRLADTHTEHRHGIQAQDTDRGLAHNEQQQTWLSLTEVRWTMFIYCIFHVAGCPSLLLVWFCSESCCFWCTETSTAPMWLFCLWIVVFVWTCPEQVGQLKIPLLLVVGEDDQNWPAQESAMDVSEGPVSWPLAEMWIYLWQNLRFLLSRWKKWWNEQGTVTCWPSYLIQTLVTWSNLRTRPTSDPPPSEQ